jgi:hypothetical protein
MSYPSGAFWQSLTDCSRRTRDSIKYGVEIALFVLPAFAGGQTKHHVFLVVLCGFGFRVLCETTGLHDFVDHCLSLTWVYPLDAVHAWLKDVSTRPLPRRLQTIRERRPELVSGESTAESRSANLWQGSLRPKGGVLLSRHA